MNAYRRIRFLYRVWQLNQEVIADKYLIFMYSDAVHFNPFSDIC